MNHHDAELSDVVIVLNDLDEPQVQECVSKLKAAGLDVSSTNADTGTIEGSIDSTKVHDLRHVSGVSYVRPVMTYTVDYPPGDPRDKDGPEEHFEDSED